MEKKYTWSYDSIIYWINIMRLKRIIRWLVVRSLLQSAVIFENGNRPIPFEGTGH